MFKSKTPVCSNHFNQRCGHKPTLLSRSTRWRTSQRVLLQELTKRLRKRDQQRRRKKKKKRKKMTTRMKMKKAKEKRRVKKVREKMKKRKKKKRRRMRKKVSPMKISHMLNFLKIDTSHTTKS